MIDSGAEAQAVLRNVFGYEHFRAPQGDIIDVITRGEDALVIMPTGGGKSLCYQIPALIRTGCAIVVSPLIALMQDQVDALSQLGVRAAFLNSNLDHSQQARVEMRLTRGDVDLLYVAPERLVQPRTMELIESLDIALFAIDEAHCVSQWGHDFRSDYLELAVLQERFPDIPRIALTATADQRTREEIAARLGLEHARHFIAGFDRPNIRYRIAEKTNPRAQLLQFLTREHRHDAGIVYCLSRKKVEDTARWLTEQGFKALPYHAGLDREIRADHQARFQREEGIIIVATIAFGMGIDKPDVRFVAHLDLPKNVEAYYQETGRAGRDGAPANAWMIYGLQDVIKLRQMLESGDGDAEHKRLEQHRLNAMLGLCEVTSCRRQVLLAYFDEPLDTPCGNCDTCLEPVATWDGTEAARQALSAVYRTGQRFGVNHTIDVLCGKATERVTQFRHDRLTVFGIGSAIDANRWRSVFRQLVARGYLAVDVGGFGGLRLEPNCRGVLRGEQSVEFREESKRPAKRLTKTPLPSDIDVGLWEALREHRRALAEAQGVPPYVIFHDRTLQEMCAAMPRDLGAFSDLNGVGTRKLDKYGAGFLAVIDAYLGKATEN